MKAWRCNLTALSQRYNIYFVACNDIINVFQPSFPDQTIPNGPELVLHLPILQHPQPGSVHLGIDIEDPHSINRIHVDYLGNDEILLVACDDGDVVGYRIEEIRKALESRSSVSTHHLFVDDVKIFLHRNVGASAWGIAVHQEGRMIAFSANTFKVTIIAFALAPRRDGAETSPEPDLSDPLPVLDDDEESLDFPSQRKRDHVFTVTAHSNIPSIAFNNTGNDPAGRWLFSNSIDGKTILFDLHSQGPSAVLQMGWCASAKHPDRSPLSDHVRCRCEDRWAVLHATWGAIFLDTLSAQDVSYTDELLSERRDEAPPYIEDASKQKQRFTLNNYVPDEDITSSNSGTPLSIMSNSDVDGSSPEASDSLADSSEESMGTGSDEENESSEDSQDQGNPQSGGNSSGALLFLQHPSNLRTEYVPPFLRPRKPKPYCEINSISLVDNDRVRYCKWEQLHTSMLTRSRNIFHAL